MLGGRTTAAFGWCAVLAVSAMSGVAIEASAQNVVFAGGPGMMGGGGMEPPVSSREVKRYSEVLGFSEDQALAAEALFEGFEAEFHAAAQKFQEAMREVRAEFEETRDPSVFMEGMEPARRKFGETSTRLETQFIEDFRLLLNDRQQSQWQHVERLRRRDRELPRGFLSAESVDLLKLVEDMKFDEQSEETLRSTLEQYELDLDRAIEERSAIRAEQRKLFEENGGGHAGIERAVQSPEYQDLNTKAVDSSKRIRDINRRYARQIAAALSPGEAARFDAAFAKAAHPDVYRESYATRLLRAANEMGDLTAEQRETITALAADYERQLATTNAQWAAAIEESEEQMKGMMSIGAGPGARMMMMEHDDGEDSELEDTRRARRELDNKIIDSVKSLLSEEQVARLPKRGEARADGGFTFGGGGGNVFVRTVEWSDGSGNGQQEVTIQVVGDPEEGGSDSGGGN